MPSANLQSLAYFIPELILTAGAMLLFLMEIFEPRRTWLHAAALVVVAASAIAAAAGVGPGERTIFLGLVAIDPFTHFFRIFFAVCTFVTILFVAGSAELREENIGEFYGLLLSLNVGLDLMASSFNLLMMYLSLEMVSIVSYLLAGYRRKTLRSKEAALKYVIYGGVASGIMIYGMSLVYGLFGSLDVAGLFRAYSSFSQGLGGTPFAEKTILVLAVLFTLAGFAYKTASVPMHMWCPDVYEGAPTAFTAFLSVAPKAAGFAVMIRFFFGIFANTAGLPETIEVTGGLPWAAVIGIISAATMTLGNFAAIPQTNLKRLLAYSSIAHAGYILMGFCCATPDGLRAMLLYLVFYLLMNLGAFLAVMAIADSTGSESIYDYSGLGYRLPFAATALAVFLFSLTGIPPLVGFLGKFYLFAAVIQRAGTWYYVLALIGILNSAVSLYYYARVVRAMFLEKPYATDPLRVSPLFNSLLGVLMAANLLPTFYWEPIRQAVFEAVRMFG